MNSLRKLYRWIPALVLMAIIFGFSSQSYEEQDLRPDIEKAISDRSIAERFSGIAFHYAGHEISIGSLGAAGFIEFFIRKSAHFSCYGLLGLLLMYALKSGGRPRRLLITVLISFLYACSDELHQMLTPGRTALFQDVLIDTAGAICGGILMILLEKWREKQGIQILPNRKE
ncbi:VanZ family protein [Paenibacillus sp. TH7-28]